MSKKNEYNPDYEPKCEHNQNAVAGCVSAEIFMACIKERDELYAKMEKKYKKKIQKLKEEIASMEITERPSSDDSDFIDRGRDTTRYGF